MPWCLASFVVDMFVWIRNPCIHNLTEPKLYMNSTYNVLGTEYQDVHRLLITPLAYSNFLETQDMSWNVLRLVLYKSFFFFRSEIHIRLSNQSLLDFFYNGSLVEKQRILIFILSDLGTNT